MRSICLGVKICISNSVTYLEQIMAFIVKICLPYNPVLQDHLYLNVHQVLVIPTRDR